MTRQQFDEAKSLSDRLGRAAPGMLSRGDPERSIKALDLTLQFRETIFAGATADEIAVLVFTDTPDPTLQNLIDRANELLRS